MQVLALDIGAHHPTLDDLHRRDRQRLLVDVARTHGDRTRNGATDVGLMNARTRPGDESIAMEDGGHDDHIGLMRRADVRVVCEEHVARVDAGVHRVVVDDIAHDPPERGRVHEHVDARDDGFAVRGHEAAVEVVALSRDRRTRHATDGHGSFVVDGPQPVTQNLEGGRVEQCSTIAGVCRAVSIHGHSVPFFAGRSSLISPVDSCTAMWPGYTTRVVVGSSTKAGPAMRAPAGRVAPS